MSEEANHQADPVIAEEEAAKPAEAVNPNKITDRTMTPGVLLAQVMLLVMAILPIYFGTVASIALLKKRAARLAAGEKLKDDEVEVIGKKDAMKFPLTASCALFGLYMITKTIDPKYLNYLLSGYFMILGVGAVTNMLCNIEWLKNLFPSCFKCEEFSLNFTSKKAKTEGETSKDDKKDQNDSNSEKSSDPEEEEIINVKFTYIEISLAVLAVFIGAWYMMTKHWIANNIFGLAFAMNAIELLQLGSFQTGVILLSGLFFYDIFWVFGTEVMVSVAKRIEAPIKIIFPTDFLTKGVFGTKQSMLGLGDIVIPGIMVALLARFDYTLGRNQDTYFKTGLWAFFIGLFVTMVVMNVFQHAQPALLYLVPTCVLFPMLVAFQKGDFAELWAFSDENNSEEEKKDK